jgi:hypothetical protein
MRIEGRRGGKRREGKGGNEDEQRKTWRMRV